MRDDLPNRRSIRLPGHDYSRPGAYFITLCTQNREPIFGKIVGGEMHLNAAGIVVDKCWAQIPVHFPHVLLDSFVIMPDHVHGIVWITHDPAHGVTRSDDTTRSAGECYSPPLRMQNTKTPTGTSKTIGSIVRGFKTGITQWVRQNTGIHDPWQRGYHERIIRNEKALNAIRRYIIENPTRWQMDRDGSVRRGE